MIRRHADNGGPAVADAELQADVMRFVAILALCLVAISSLVEGYRLSPPSVQASESPAPPDRHPVEPAERVPSPGQLEATPRAGLSPDSEPSALLAGVPAPARTAQPPIVEPAPSAPDDTGESPGLTLRFLTDAALLRLVARGDAGVFVLAGPESLALDLSDGVSFRPAPAPARFHSMATETVPAVLRAHYSGPHDVTWGVTLPEHTIRAIELHVANSGAGELVIDAQGRVSLERADE
jgi:hypothetical protein